MVLNSYNIKVDSGASGGGYIHLVDHPSGTAGTADFNFDGVSGEYDIVVSYWDESDGDSAFELEQDTTLISEWNADQNLDPSPQSTIKKVTRTIATDIKVNSGDSFTLRGITDEYEFARVDYLEFVPVKEAVSSDWDSFSGGSGGSQSGSFKFFDNVINSIATYFGTSAEDILKKSAQHLWFHNRRAF